MRPDLTMDIFFLSRTDSRVSQCNLSTSHVDAYSSLIAVSREADGTSVLASPIALQPLVFSEASAYTSLTGCSVQEPTSPSSEGPTTGMLSFLTIPNQLSVPCFPLCYELYVATSLTDCCTESTSSAILRADSKISYWCSIWILSQ